MKSKINFIEELMKEINFPQEAQEVLLDFSKQMEEKPEALKILDELTISMMETEVDNHDLQNDLNKLAETISVNSYTLDLYFLMRSAQALKEAYEKNNIPLSIYWDSMKDLTYKLKECYDVHGVWGTFVFRWFPGFFRLNRFALGRFQYEPIEFTFEHYQKGNVELKKGDIVYNMHIPSSGPMKKEDRLDSYKKAYEFYGKKPIIIVCNSWLLFPDHEKFLPKNSNILDFMKDFDIINRKTQNPFEDAWRIFGKDASNPPNQLPRNTSLQRAFADWFLAGNEAGMGYGVLIFDGEKII